MKRWPIRWPARGALAGSASWVCWLLSHPEALACVRDRGVVWVCPECQRGHVSQAFRPRSARGLSVSRGTAEFPNKTTDLSKIDWGS